MTVIHFIHLRSDVILIEMENQTITHLGDSPSDAVYSPAKSSAFTLLMYSIKKAYFSPKAPVAPCGLIFICSRTNIVKCELNKLSLRRAQLHIHIYELIPINVCLKKKKKIQII